MTLRFAVACRAGAIQVWQQRCIDELFACGCADWVGLIESGESWELYPPPPPLFDVPAQRVAPVKTGDRALVRCDGTDALALTALDLDVVLCFGRPAPSAFAAVARHGAWEFRFGADADAREPACFWECYRQDCVAQLALAQRSSGGGWTILRRAATGIDGVSLCASIDRALETAALLPTVACRLLAAGGGVAQSAQDAPAATSARQANGLSGALLHLKIFFRHFARMFDMLFVDKWNVGIARCTIEQFLQRKSWPHVDWLTELDGLDYRADPFGAAVDGRAWALVERYDSRTARGRIEAFEIVSDAWLDSCREAMTAPAHMSYPFLVSDGGELYCVPETFGQNSVSLYRAMDLPSRWEKTATLIEGFEAVDATLVRHEERWWLFCTDLRKPRHHRLHAFYADNVTGPYAPHELNPVKIDPRSAGCAGSPFVVDGSLYRPAQDCSRTYGAQVVLNRIVELTPRTFREEISAIVAPSPTYPAGFHTLSSFGSSTLVDGKRRAFTLRRVAWRLSWPLRRWRQRHA